MEISYGAKQWPKRFFANISIFQHQSYETSLYCITTNGINKCMALNKY
jgi:hypothetical protein